MPAAFERRRWIGGSGRRGLAVKLRAVNEQWTSRGGGAARLALPAATSVMLALVWGERRRPMYGHERTAREAAVPLLEDPHDVPDRRGATGGDSRPIRPRGEGGAITSCGTIRG